MDIAKWSRESCPRILIVTYYIADRVLYLVLLSTLLFCYVVSRAHTSTTAEVLDRPRTGVTLVYYYFEYRELTVYVCMANLIISHLHHAAGSTVLATEIRPPGRRVHFLAASLSGLCDVSAPLRGSDFSCQQCMFSITVDKRTWITQPSA